MQLIEGLKQSVNHEYENSYNTYLTNLQKSLLEEDKTIPICVLFHIIEALVKINKENLDGETATEEMKNYLKLLKGIAKDSDLYYIKGMVFLIEIIYSHIFPEYRDYQSIIAEASEHFAYTGIEDLANESLVIQYNINEWLEISDSKLKQVLVKPKKYENPEQIFLELLNKAKRTIFLEKLKTTEHDIIKRTI